MKSRRQTLHRRAAEVLLASPAPEAEALAHHFTQAGQTELAIEWWGKAGDQALRRSAFAEAISHLGKAIELSDKAGGAAPRARSCRDRLGQPAAEIADDYGQAVMWAKGFAAEETKAAFARAGELATEIGDAEAPLDAYYARWAHSFFRGELGSAREAAESFLREAERAARPTEAAAAHRLLGLTRLFQGDFAQARAHFEQALRIYDPERDREAKFRFGLDSGVAATAYLALAAWCLGDVARARELMDEAVARAVESAHAPTLANAYLYQAMLEILRDDAEAARRAAEAVVALSREHGLALYLACGALPLAWARAKLGDRDAGSAELRQALADYASQGNKLLSAVLSRAARGNRSRAGRRGSRPGRDRRSAGAGGRDRRALVRRRTPSHSRRNPPQTKPRRPRPRRSRLPRRHRRRATAKGPQLRAARRAVAGQALPVHGPPDRRPRRSGAGAGRLFADAGVSADRGGEGAVRGARRERRVKAATASRERRLKLQTSYGQAMAWSKGFAAEETKTALVQTERLVAQSDNVAERMKARYARYLVLIVSGEARSAQDEAARFLREAKKAGDLPAVCSAERALALTCLFRGQLSEARQHSSEALRADDPGWEASARRVHGPDYRVTAKAFLAVVDWLLGDAAGAAAQFQEALAEAMASNHAPTIANTNWYKAHLEAARGDPEATRRAANAALEVAEKISLQMFVSMAGTFQDWARARLGDADGLARFRGHSETLISQTFHMAPLFYGRLAELEAEQVSADTALTSIDRAIESARKGDVRYVDSLLHRIRADILLKAHPDDPAPAEQAYLAAIAVAREQGARSFGLQAALKLAKLYQSTARPVEAHDLLVPALEGFSPTPEMPEIAEAQAMLEVARQFVSGVRFGVSSGRYPTAVDLPNGWFTTSGLVEAVAVARRH